MSRRFNGDSCVTIVKTMGNHLPGLADKSRDTLVLINVLEHIEEDDDAVAHFHWVLKPGRHLVLFATALSFLVSDLDRAAGHYNRYYPRSLGQQVEAASLEICTARYMDVLGILPRLLVTALGEKRKFDPRMARAYDHIGIPVTRFVEALVLAPIGKSFLLVARRLF